MKKPHRRPEGAMLAALRGRMSVRHAASLAGMSEGRWRQIEAGYASLGRGQYAEVVAPARTLAAMARAVGATTDDLAKAGREDAVIDFLAIQPTRSEVDDAFAAIDALPGTTAAQREAMKAMLRGWQGDEEKPGERRPRRRTAGEQ